ncbi:hypothetical protein NNJEOMEG_00073 [Fundidesulfovibrio magnetotacticus]|uniref:Uncharacterized protein n=1 Tax=Fundidesulfovibrio magnetotacticus TaxID=2730080 RepID=A0A6V8LP28_9BACT|nr:hypothetical protein [Fundidesulfovibrio magnetotacticus]GFK92251.1 hypothetical protein NNJEOMEG_00073 [Fundidesulfovibrio magnetotacticus]
MPHQQASGLSGQFYAHWALLQQEARRRFPRQEALADLALTYLHEKCSENDWRRLKEFQGNCSFKTFLRAVAVRLLEDFARARFGRRRPPKWLLLKGGFWERLFRLLCLEGLGRQAAVETYDALSPGAPGRRALLDACTAILENIPDCGSSAPRETSLDDAPEPPAPSEPCAHQHDPEDILAIRERVAFLQAFRLCLDLPGEDGPDPDPEFARRVLETMRPRLELTAEERLFLRLVHQDGLGVSEAGRMLGLGQDQAHGRMRRLLGRIKVKVREVLESLGVSEHSIEFLRILGVP